MSPTGRYDPLADGGSSRRRGKNRPAPIRGRLYLIQLPLKPAPLVQVNVGLMANTVSSAAHGDRLLTLHNVKLYAPGGEADPVQARSDRLATPAKSRSNSHWQLSCRNLPKLGRQSRRFGNFE